MSSEVAYATGVAPEAIATGPIATAVVELAIVSNNWEQLNLKCGPDFKNRSDCLAKR